ncbi:MAG: GAF domain-containing sensor histidine kinase [Anaerolineae bacterium]|nr:GAF domain-containing sensor histidine kinase [Anaerolineae bacterium]
MGERRQQILGSLSASTPELIALKAENEALQANLAETQERLAALYVVHEVAQTVTSELNLEPLLHKILGAAVQVMNASAGSLLLLDEFTDELVFAVVEGGGGGKLRGVRMARDKGVAGWVATHSQPLIVDDVNKDDRYYQSIAQSFGLKLTSLLCVPMISHNKLIGVLEVVHTAAGRYFGDLDQQLLTTFANQAAIAIENARLYENLKKERDHLVVVEDEVRKRLARDLHDGPTQLLASIVMSLSYTQQLLERAPEHVPKEIEESAAVAERALKQLRTLLFDLRPVTLETQGLVPALEVYAERLQETEQLNVVFTNTGEFERLSEKAEVAIFAVVQEAINNAKKHAQASRIDLILEPKHAADTLTIRIKDNGSGFDAQAVKARYDERGSLGMINMQERAEVVNGTFKIYSEVGQGTEVILSLPLTENLLGESKDE